MSIAGMDNMGPAERIESAWVARKFFVEGMTKSAIAEELGTSRFRVARMLDKAQQLGIVRIEIEVPSDLNDDLSARLRSKFGLRRALVVSTPPGVEQVVRDSLARTAADYLTEVVDQDDVLGIGWGRTLDSTVDVLQQLSPCTVVQMTGMVGSVSRNSVELVRRVAALSGGRAFPLYAPLYLHNAATLAGLGKQAGIAAALKLHSKISIALIAIGSWTPPNSRVYDAMTAADRKRLRDRGTVAELCGSVFLDDQGREVPSPMAGQTLAIDSRDLRRIPEVIGVAGGQSKVAAVRAALLSEIVHTLITDTTAAEALLTEKSRPLRLA